MSLFIGILMLYGSILLTGMGAFQIGRLSNFLTILISNKISLPPYYFLLTEIAIQLSLYMFYIVLLLKLVKQFYNKLHLTYTELNSLRIYLSFSVLSLIMLINYYIMNKIRLLLIHNYAFIFICFFLIASYHLGKTIKIWYDSMYAVTITSSSTEEELL